MSELKWFVVGLALGYLLGAGNSVTSQSAKDERLFTKAELSSGGTFVVEGRGWKWATKWSNQTEFRRD